METREYFNIISDFYRKLRNRRVTTAFIIYFAKRNGCRAVIPVFHFAPKPVDSRLRTIEPTRRVRGENAAMQKRYGLGWATASDPLTQPPADASRRKRV